MKNYKSKICSLAVSFTMLLNISIGAIGDLLSLRVHADTINADGSITKTATAEYDECDGGWTEHCSGGGTRRCTGGSTTTSDYWGSCNCGAVTFQVGSDTYCDACGARVAADLCSYSYSCEACGNGGGGSARHYTYSHGTISYTCSHGNSSAHDIDHECSHGYLYSHDVFEGYYNRAYGYSSYSSSTFKVWPISATAEGSLSYALNVVGASATDAAIAGKTVQITASGAPVDAELKVTNSSTGEVKILSGSNMTYSFTMSASPTTLAVQYVDSVRVTDLVYGQTLGDSTFTDYNPPCEGHWEWDDPDLMPQVFDSNTTEFSITFYPDDPDTPVTSRTKKVIITKYSAPLTNANVEVSEITYGNTLDNAIITGTLPQLNGTDIPGVFEWVNPSETPNAGTQSFDMEFTPTDTANIETTLFDVQVIVNQAPITLTDDMIASISATDIVYEQALADSVLSGDGPLPGHYEWVEPTIRPAVIDSEITPYDVKFVPDDTNYACAYATCTLKVSKKAYTFTPENISCIIASDISYGQPLADSTFSGFKPVPGEYSWDDDSIFPNVNDANNYPVTFTPADLDNYEIVSVGNIHVSVNKARPDISLEQIQAIEVTPIDYLQTLDDSTITAESGTPGVFEWEDPTIAPSVADSGTTGFNIKFTPDDTENFDTILIPITIIVNKINPPVPSDLANSISSTGIIFGQALADSALSYTGADTLNGTLVWEDNTVTPAMADSDNTDFNVQFVYIDDINYNRLPYVAKVHVDKAPAPVNLQDMVKIINVYLGTYRAYNLTSNLDLAGLNAESFTFTDIEGLFEIEPTINNNVVSFKIKPDRELDGKQADINIEVSSRDYLNFNIILRVVTSNCEHRDLSYGVGRESATCTEEGYTGNTVCNTCGLTIRYGSAIRLKDHWEIVRDAVEATCTTKGYSGDIYCFNCDQFLERGHETDMIPHTEGEPVIDIAPTETSIGYCSYFCTVCGAFMHGGIVPKLGTAEPDNPEEPSEHQHTWEVEWQFDDVNHWRDCTTCDACIRELHTLGEGEFLTATCLTEGDVKYTCTICGYEVVKTEVPGHRYTWEPTDIGHIKKCKVCGEVYDTLQHSFERWAEIKAPTGTELGVYSRKCAQCGYTEEIEATANPSSDNPDTGIELWVIRQLWILVAAVIAKALSVKCRL